MGLLGNVLQPLFVGGHCVLMPPVSFLRRPIRWLRAITRYRGTTAGAPSFGYDLCLRIADDELAAGQRRDGRARDPRADPGIDPRIDLRSWQVAFCGAEPVRAATLRRFAEKMRRCGFRREAFYPCYGLAEATLLVAGGDRADPPVVRSFDRQALERHAAVPADAGGGDDAVALVGCGRAWGGAEIAIVDPARGVRAAAGEVGEIWVRGGHVAPGYWDRGPESEATFGARLAGGAAADGDAAAGGSATFLRTGDLGFTDGGQLYVTGRLKDLVIVAGRNHYPQDIERTVEVGLGPSLAGGAAAFAVDVDGEERLAVVAEVDAAAAAGAGAAPLASVVRRAIAEAHGLALQRLAFVRRGAIPKTSSGKVQRRACRALLAAGGLEAVFAWEAPSPALRLDPTGAGGAPALAPDGPPPSVPSTVE
jgi:acyl-CoA synthetase (AMP-forming)/AMP-acid ligase II